MTPELIISSRKIDFEICERLGEQSSDFLVLCFDGVQFVGFPTPFDTPENRIQCGGLAEKLNDTSSSSLWPELWQNWKAKICNQFGLHEATTATDYRPVVSYKISRVCPGYSEHLHVAIRLFETVADKIKCWEIGRSVRQTNNYFITIRNTQGKTFFNHGGKLPALIAKTVRDLLVAP